MRVHDIKPAEVSFVGDSCQSLTDRLHLTPVSLCFETQCDIGRFFADDLLWSNRVGDAGRNIRVFQQCFFSTTVADGHDNAQSAWLIKYWCNRHTLF